MKALWGLDTEVSSALSAGAGAVSRFWFINSTATCEPLVKVSQKREVGAHSMGGFVKIMRRGNAMGAKFAGSSLCHVAMQLWPC